MSYSYEGESLYRYVVEAAAKAATEDDGDKYRDVASYVLKLVYDGFDPESMVKFLEKWLKESRAYVDHRTKESDDNPFKWGSSETLNRALNQAIKAVKYL